MFFKLVGTVLYHTGRIGVVIVLVVALCNSTVFLTEGIQWWFLASLWLLGEALIACAVSWGIGYLIRVTTTLCDVAQSLDV